MERTYQLALPADIRSWLSDVTVEKPSNPAKVRAYEVWRKHRASNVFTLLVSKAEEDFNVRAVHGLDATITRLNSAADYPKPAAATPSLSLRVVDGLRAVVAPNAPNASPSDHERDAEAA